ncbi:MAG: glutamate racemase [Bacteroidota bacterium]
MSKAPIGMLDSGLGGLSVWREVATLLPKESIHYIADSLRCPYGNKEESEVKTITKELVEILLGKGCKLIVLACNTATAVAIQELRATYDIPFVGMEPALKPAAKLTKTGHIGILATENTFKGAHFHRTKENWAADKEVHIQPGYGLVEAVEKGSLEGKEVEALLRPLIQPMMEAKVDQLVLGCTHYPFLSNAIHEITRGKINLIDPAPAVAMQVKRILTEHQWMNVEESPSWHFYSSANVMHLKQFLDANLPESRLHGRTFEKLFVQIR